MPVNSINPSISFELDIRRRMEMNQELLGFNGGFNGDCKTSSINGGNLNPQPSLLSGSPSSSSYSIKTAAAPSHAEQQSLRCPRCESSNTKFCYYNNYSLMQPRHFCKTCRRYWTRGGALRNIPIGGGRRKWTRGGALRRSSSMMTQMFHQQSSLNHHHHHLGFLRAHRNPNQAATSAEATMNGGLEVMTNVVARSRKSSSMEFSSSIWRDGDQTVSSGAREFHRKLRFSPENIFSDHPSVFLSNLPSSSAASMLISTPVTGGDFSCFYPAFSCLDLPATRSAYL